MRILAAVTALLLSGCFKLDPFLYVPERVSQYVLDPNGATPEETVTADRIEPVTIPVSGEDIQLGAAYIRANVQPPLGYVIFFHGKGGNLDTTMKRLKRYANLGYDCLGYDYRGWGMSTDVPPTEAGLERDGQAVVAYMRGRVPPDQLFYAGQSFGTATATQAAAVTPPRALIIESGFASIAEFEAESTSMDLPQTFISADGWDTAARLKTITVPTLFFHGTDDDLIRPTHMQINYDASTSARKEKHLVEGASHSDVPEVMGQAYADAIHAFIAPALASAP